MSGPYENTVRQSTDGLTSKGTPSRYSFFYIIVLFAALLQQIGCKEAGSRRVYRESDGEVAAFKTEPADPVLRVATFVRLRDGSVIHPRLYYYQIDKSGILGGARRVEKPGRTFRSMGRELESKSRKIYLPLSEEISSYLFLVSTNYSKDIEVMRSTETIYLRDDWQLLELATSDLSPTGPIVFPKYAELKERELSGEREASRRELVKLYERAAKVARRKSSTPVGQKPMDCESPRETGTYLKGCGEVKVVFAEISDSQLQVARFVRLRDGTVLMPKLMYFSYEAKAKEGAHELQLLESDGHASDSIDLPLHDEIQEYLLLVRSSFGEHSEPDSEEVPTLSSREPRAANPKWTAWELVEIPGEYISAGKRLKFPPYEELTRRKLSGEKRKLLNELVERYQETTAELKKQRATPRDQLGRLNKQYNK